MNLAKEYEKLFEENLILYTKNSKRSNKKSHRDSPYSVSIVLQTCVSCNFPRPCPWPGYCVDASRIRGAVDWSGYLESKLNAYSADMSVRRCNDVNCNDSVVPCRNYRSMSSVWWHNTDCRR